MSPLWSLFVVFALQWRFAVSVYCLPLLSNGDCCYPSEEFYKKAWEIGHHCIYGYVVEKNWRRLNKQNQNISRQPDQNLDQNQTISPEKKISLLADRPPWSLGQPPVVTVAKGWIRSITVNEATQEFSMMGAYRLVWLDDRLTWTRSVSKSTSFLTTHVDRIWEPELVRSVDINNVGYTYAGARVENTGGVQAIVMFHTSDSCSFDYTHFPYDEHTCCTTFSLYHSGTTVSLRYSSMKPAFIGALSRLWALTRIQGTSAMSGGYILEGGLINRSSFSMCATIKRRSASAVNEFILPLAVSTVLVIVLPFFGWWKMQALAKCFCLCLQYSCLFTLVLETDQLQFGSTTPVILRYYDFLIWTTAFNLLITMLFWSLSRRFAECNRPPSSALISFSDVINNRIWCSQGDKNIDRAALAMPETMTGDHTHVHMDISYNDGKKGQWECVWRAANTLCTFLFALIYLFGLCMLAV